MKKVEADQLALAIQYIMEVEPTVEDCNFDRKLFSEAMKNFHGPAEGMKILTFMLKEHKRKNP